MTLVGFLSMRRFEVVFASRRAEGDEKNKHNMYCPSGGKAGRDRPQVCSSSVWQLIQSDRSLCLDRRRAGKAVQCRGTRWKCCSLYMAGLCFEFIYLTAGSLWPQEHCWIHWFQYKFSKQWRCVGSADTNGLLPRWVWAQCVVPWYICPFSVLWGSLDTSSFKNNQTWSQAWPSLAPRNRCEQSKTKTRCGEVGDMWGCVDPVNGTGATFVPAQGGPGSFLLWRRTPKDT